MACPLASERVWLEKSRFAAAEREYYESLSKLLKGPADQMPATDLRDKMIVVGNSDASASQIQVSPTTSVASGKSKKTKKSKQAISAPNTNNSDNPAVVKEVPVVESPAVNEETKTKKKKKKKSNKETAVTKTSEQIQKENVPPATVAVVPTQEDENSLWNSATVEESSKSKKKNKKKNNHKEVVTVTDVIVPPPETVDGSNSASEVDIATPLESGPIAKKTKNAKNKAAGNQCTLVSEIAKARQHIKSSLEKMDGIASLAASPASAEVLDRLVAVEKENSTLHQLIEKLSKTCLESEKRIKSLEEKLSSVTLSGTPAPAAAPAAAASAADDDDGVDLFASESEGEDDEAAKIREERLAAYAAKKSKKPALIAKSSLVLDVKPWDDETDLKLMEAEIRKITCDGLLWGASKFVPVAFGIQKLSISCVVEDDKVSIDWLTEEIEKNEDFVQSVDVAAFNKI